MNIYCNLSLNMWILEKLFYVTYLWGFIYISNISLQVCYYGQHYHCFAYSHDHERWIMYDDKTVKVKFIFCLLFYVYVETWNCVIMDACSIGDWQLGWCTHHVWKRAFATTSPILWSCKLILIWKLILYPCNHCTDAVLVFLACTRAKVFEVVFQDWRITER